jgi:hypothetical protein
MKNNRTFRESLRQSLSSGGLFFSVLYESALPSFEAVNRKPIDGSAQSTGKAASVRLVLAICNY